MSPWSGAPEPSRRSRAAGPLPQATPRPPRASRRRSPSLRCGPGAKLSAVAPGAPSCAPVQPGRTALLVSRCRMIGDGWSASRNEGIVERCQRSRSARPRHRGGPGTRRFTPAPGEAVQGGGRRGPCGGGEHWAGSAAVPPADEAGDRAVPGRREGDLIRGTANRSAILTLVGQTTPSVIPWRVPYDHRAERVATPSAHATGRLLVLLRRSPARDQGRDMTAHARSSVATDAPVFSCDPQSPWRRGTNENTNASGALTGRKEPTCRFTAEPTSTTSHSSATSGPTGASDSRNNPGN